MTERRLSAEERRFMERLTEKITAHECSYALHPLSEKWEYCQFCGDLREVAP